jgi:serine/threonine protein kinase/tetratricopeptide (TPR) repeat protein
MSTNHPDLAEREERLSRVLVQCLEALDRGEVVGRQDLLASYPEFAAELGQFLDDQERVDRCAAPLRAVARGLALRPAGTGSECLGDFRIIREVGRGGMAVVYEAEQVSLGRPVALKVLPLAATLDTKHLQRFHNEARAAAGLHHGNIVPVYFVGSERGIHFYAMQFIDGQTLADLLAQLRRPPGRPPAAAGEAPVPPAATEAREAGAETPRAAALSTERAGRGQEYYRTVARWGVEAAEALDYAHQVGVVHRDIKPANLLLDPAGRLWVTDFGLARIQSEASLTATGDLVGTLRYMSPEQALARRVPIDHRTDIYSLGATLYELLTLQPAFPGSDRQELLRQITFDDPCRPRRLNHQVPADLEVIVLKALEKSPADRYATAQELADDLRHWLDDRPIRARRPALRTRLRRWGRRHRPLVAAVAAALLMGIAVLGAGLGWVARDRAARRAAAERVIAAALDESASWQHQRRLPEALSAARRADGLLASADVGTALRQQVRARLADLELLDRLENVGVEIETGIKGGQFVEAADHGLYGQILRAAGLDVEALPPEEVGERIARSTVAVELAAVLDSWALSCRAVRGEDDPSWKHLFRVARVADPDPWRARVRDASERWDLQALRTLAASEETLRLPPATLYVVGKALREDEEAPGQAEVFLREAQRRHPNDFWLNHNLFRFLRTLQPPQREEAVRFAAVAVALRPDSPGAHGNLGTALRDHGRLDEAITGYREAIRLKPDDAKGHSNLGVALSAKGRTDEAIAEQREAIRLDKDYPLAHYNLGVDLHHKRRLNEAIAEYRKAIGLDNNISEAHYNLGNLLRDKELLDEAVTEFREAIRIKKDKADAHCNLGRVLQRQGQFAEALVYLRRGHELGSRDPSWRYPSAEWVRECERLVQLDRKLPAILSGQQEPADVAERLGLAQLCQLPCQKRYVAAVRFFEQAFGAEPKLTGDQPSLHRYNAACAAALAGCGQGTDAGNLDDKERARLRQQALDWLRADLEAWRRLLEKGPDKNRPAIAQQLQRWLDDSDFAGVRGGEALARLPEAERGDWQKLWQEVEALRQRAAGPPKKPAPAAP